MTMNVPKHHHFVPQFFLESWAKKTMKKKQEVYLLNGYNTKDSREFPGSTRNVCEEIDLYTFVNSEIETLFINPYVDSPLQKYVNDVVDKSWNELNYSSREGFFKFLLLLDARNPNSLNSIAEAYSSIQDKLDFSKSNGDAEILIKDGMFGFICIAIHELELKNFEDTKNTYIKKALEDIQISIAETESSKLLFPKFLTYLLNPRVICKEVISNTNFFVTSTSPVRRFGRYDKEFLVVLNVSPKKSLLFSNKKEMIDAITAGSKEEVIEKINHLNKNQINKEFPVPQLIFYPFD